MFYWKLQHVLTSPELGITLLKISLQIPKLQDSKSTHQAGPLLMSVLLARIQQHLLHVTFTLPYVNMAKSLFWSNVKFCRLSCILTYTTLLQKNVSPVPITKLPYSTVYVVSNKSVLLYSTKKWHNNESQHHIFHYSSEF